MKVTLRISSLFFGLVLWSATAWAQPANDICSGAVDLTIYDSEEESIPVGGDTRNTTDGALDNIPVCSANFFRDDVWYTVTAPAVTPQSGYAVRIYLNEEPTDMDSFGIAIYNSCAANANNVAIFCANSPGENQAVACLNPNQTVYIRVWSAHGTAANWQDGWGTFRIAVFPVKTGDSEDAVVLWGDQPGQGDFDGGLNDWTAEGLLCAGGVPAENAVWTWTQSGFPTVGYIDQPLISPIKSRTYCNGSVIFDSGGLQSTGACPWMDHEGALRSPVIDLTPFDVRGISILFNQSMLRFSSGRHFIDYSFDGGAEWDTIEINTEKSILSTASPGEGYHNEEMRVRLPGAEDADSLVVRFRFFGFAYWWIIDDVRIIETECNNLRINTQGVRSFYAIQPWAKIPVEQVREFGALADIENIGACPQTNVQLNYTIENTVTGEIMYNETLDYGTLDADVSAENRLFPELINLPKEVASYRGTYTLTSDSTDFKPADNTISFTFDVGGDVFANENGATRALSVNPAIYDPGAPESWVYGNVFRPEEDVTVKHVTWGVNNADTMVAYQKFVNLILFQWTDTNGDKIAEVGERRYVGIAEHVFEGVQPADGIYHTVLENFDDPSAPIVMKANFQYLMMVEYSNKLGANNLSEPQIELLASEDYNYGAQILAMDTAYTYGLTEDRLYMTAVGLPTDGNVANIDYEVTTIDNTRRRFGDDIVPLIRIEIDRGVNTTDPLPLNNEVSVYPNPATDNVQVKFDFENAHKNVQLRFINPLGQTVFQKVIAETITTHVEPIDVRQLSAGTYLLQVETVEGQRSIPVVIMK